MTHHSSRVPPGVRRLLRLPWNRARMLRDFDDEVRFHLEMRIADLRALGLSEAEAEAAARNRFGDADELLEYRARAGERYARRTRVVEWLRAWGQDIRFAARHFRNAPGFTAVAVLTLALGIGANAAIFSVVHHLLLDPLPYPGGNRIVMLREAAGTGDMMFPVNAPLMRAWQSRAHTLESFATVSPRTVRLSADPGDTVAAAAITPSYIQMLGVQPVLGRGFTPDEARSGAPTVAMVGYGLWQSRFAGRRDVLGSVIDVNGSRLTVVGVTPPNMAIPMSRRPAPAIWTPVSLDSVTGNFGAFARLRSGATTETASDELQAIVTTLPDTSKYSRLRARAVRAQDLLDKKEAHTVEVLFAAVGVLLLIACVNVANLLLARAWSRRREFAIRVALGAGRARLARLVLTESVALALMGGALGLFIAWQGLRVIIALRPPSLEDLAGVRIEPAVLFWTTAIAVVTGILFGSAPALLSDARSIGGALQSESRTGSAGVTTRRVRGALVVAELALSLVLLVSAGLLARSFVALQRMNIGFDPHGLLSIGAMTRGPMDADHRAALRTAMLERIRAVPGVVDATVGSLPGQGWSVASEIEVDDNGHSRAAGIREFTGTFVSPGYFHTARIALLEGRAFDSTDHGSSSIVINRSLAERLWPNGGAIGSRMRTGANGEWSTVIGIVADIRMPGFRGGLSDLQTYSLPPAQIPGGALLVRAAVPAATIAPALRQAVASVDPAVMAGAATTGDAYLHDSMAPSRFSLALIGTFGLVALVLSAVGLYGVISYTVSQRTREIGVRVALGAEPGDVARLVVGDGLRLVAGGVVVGVAVAAATTRALDSMLYGVTSGDPLTFVAIALLLTAIALVASYVPARRALRVDPIDALRTE